ncbi:MAG: serine/threonine-protein kinase [Kofleriaceae bacterium]
MSSLPRSAALGDQLGRYQLLVSIGQGGMAEVLLGRLRGAAGFAKLVVIKRMHSHLSHDQRFIDMFINEGRLVAQLSHPNICQVHELGEEAGALFLAMEYLHGVSWEELVRVVPRGHPAELPLIAGVLAQACDGLHHAHQLRDRAGNATPVVHRDVSPQNLFVTTDGVCKVLDFGVAKLSTSDRYSQSGVVKGKLPYMSPEQIGGHAVDARTDVFAMGVVLWEALTGRRLFARTTDYQIWKAINEEPIPPLPQLRPELPPAIDAVVSRALQRDPARRYQSITELAQAIRRDFGAPPLDHAAIAAALRSLCAEQLAVAEAVVARALDDADEPDRAGPRDDDPAQCAETLLSGIVPSVMLRSESVPQLAAPTRRRRSRAWLAIPAAIALLVAGGVWLASTRGLLGPPRGAIAAAPPDATPQDVEPAAAPPDAAPETATPPGDAEVELTDVEPPAPPPGADDAPASERPEESSRASAKKTRSRRRERVTGTTPTEEVAGSASAPPPAEPPAARAPQIGHYSVDSRPYATISIDGVDKGETPLYRIPLPEGPHRVRAERSDGTIKTFSITIVGGKEVSSGRLQW